LRLSNPKFDCLPEIKNCMGSDGALLKKLKEIEKQQTNQNYDNDIK
jgi:hypothetical protein